MAAYDPGWPGLFRELRDRVDAALAGIVHVTEHVGSTAVPGLDAKPVIDLDVVVPDDAAAGRGRQGASRRRVAASRGTSASRAGRRSCRPPMLVYHHLYAVVAGSQPHRDHIDLRDFARAHPVHAARYGSLKRRLGAAEADRSAYSYGKAEMISDLLRQARR